MEGRCAASFNTSWRQCTRRGLVQLAQTNCIFLNSFLSIFAQYPLLTLKNTFRRKMSANDYYGGGRPQEQYGQGYYPPQGKSTHFACGKAKHFFGWRSTWFYIPNDDARHILSQILERLLISFHLGPPGGGGYYPQVCPTTLNSRWLTERASSATPAVLPRWI